jgi:hypothetical protein
MAVGGASDAQAQRLTDGGVQFPLLLDPQGALRSALGLDDKLSRGELMGWRSIRNLLVGMVKQRQGRVSRPHTEDRPAVVILDSGRRVVWSHVGRAVGDYPSIDEILAAIPSAGAE